VILVDSDVLVEQLRGNPAARDWLVEVRRTRGRLRASQVTAVELLGGMRSDERHRVRALVDSLELLDVDGRVARQAGVLMRQFRRSHSGIGLADYLIAATAQVQGLELATLNIRHFPMVEGLSPPF